MTDKLAKEWQTLDLKAHELATGGDMAGAEKTLKQAIKLAKKIGPEGVMLQLNSLFGLSLVQEALENEKGFIETNNEMLTLVNSVQEMLGASDIAVVYTKVAENFEALGHMDKAGELLEEAVELFEEAEEFEGEYIGACTNLARYKLEIKHDLAAATKLSESALTAAIDLMDPHLVSSAAVSCATIAFNGTSAGEAPTDTVDLKAWAIEQCRKAIEYLDHPDDDALEYLAQVRHTVSTLLVGAGQLEEGLAEALAADADFVKFYAKVEAGEIAHDHDHDHVHGPDCNHDHDEADPEELIVAMAINRTQIAMVYRALHAQNGNDELVAKSNEYCELAASALKDLSADSPGAEALRRLVESLQKL